MNKQTDRFDIIRQLTLAGSRGEDMVATSRRALQQAARMVGLSAASLYVWDDDPAEAVTVVWAESEADREKLRSLEEDLFSQLRKNRQLTSAYMSFGGATPCHSFTLPLQHGDETLGAVIGLQEGERTIVAEDAFLEVLSASLTLNRVASGASRLAGIRLAAVTTNHHVNNSLQIILNAAQLMFRDESEKTRDQQKKVDAIATSVDLIREVTKRLSEITEPRVIVYGEGVKMLDIFDEGESEDDEGEKPSTDDSAD